VSLPTYLDLPVLSWRPDWSPPSPSHEVRSLKERLETPGGRFADDPLYETITRRARMVRYVVKGRTAIEAARTALLEEIPGRLKPFWLVSWTPDLQLTAELAIGAVDLTVTPLGYDRFLAGEDKGHLHLALWPRSNGGEPVYRQITGNSVEAGAEVLTLDSPLEVLLDQRDPVCWLALSRLDSDEVVIRWENMDVATLELPIIDLPLESS
jgi:hypothetical protein